MNYSKVLQSTKLRSIFIILKNIKEIKYNKNQIT